MTKNVSFPFKSVHENINLIETIVFITNHFLIFLLSSTSKKRSHRSHYLRLVKFVVVGSMYVKLLSEEMLFQRKNNCCLESTSHNTTKASQMRLRQNATQIMFGIEFGDSMLISRTFTKGNYILQLCCYLTIQLCYWIFHHI